MSKVVTRTDKSFFNDEQKKLIKEHILKGAPDFEIERFFITCERTGLDPFSRQIYGRIQNQKLGRKPGAKRGDKDEWLWGKVVVIITSIDGLRAIAERSGEYRGQTQPEWYYLDEDTGKPGWQDVCIIKRSKGNPLTKIDACRVGVKRLGFDWPVYGVANFDSFAVYEKGDGESGEWQLSTFWRKMPEHMIAKVAEAQALRKAFPTLAQGLYIEEEVKDPEADEHIPDGGSAPLPSDMRMVNPAGEKTQRQIAEEALASATTPNTEKTAPAPKATPKPTPQPKAAPPPTDEEQNPFDLEPVEPVTSQEPGEKQDWEDYQIKTITTAKYAGKMLKDLAFKDLQGLMDGWVLKFSDKIAQNPDKKREAEMITKAFEAQKS